MEIPACPKCNETMDDGWTNLSGSSFMGYISKKQTGFLKTVTKISQAHACPKCGYVELYLDPAELKQKIT